MLFDAHNHIHLGHHISPTLFNTKNLAGLSIMSTHPRDFPVVETTCTAFAQRGLLAVPNYGAHPWFLHEITEDDDDDTNSDYKASWINELKERLENDPKACVGEIGLDGLRWHVKPGNLATPISKQQRIFECSCFSPYMSRHS